MCVSPTRSPRWQGVSAVRKAAFYLRMAAQNLHKNALFYRPFALTSSGCAAMCYIMWYLRYNELIEKMPGSTYISTMLTMGSGIMVFLVVWIMLYANSFVMKRRRRELALYNILGMEKRHVAVVLGLETVFLCAGSVVAGVAGGALFSKLVLILLLNLLRFQVPMGFSFCWKGAQQTAIGFAALFGFLYLKNLWQMRTLSPIELLHSGSAGEQEPKSRRLLALFGVLALGAGYGLSFFTEQPALVILLFFAAVALVIIGTHCLFGAGSVVVLKGLRRNKKFYYKPRNFTAVSGMLYRMNQNARGLANICILATTVLVSVATTVCLYAGAEESLARNFPDEIRITASLEPENYLAADFTPLDRAVQEAAAVYGCAPGEVATHARTTLSARWNGSGCEVNEKVSADAQDAFSLFVVTAEDYTRTTGEAVSLQAGEVLWYGGGALPDSLAVGGETFAVAGRAEQYPHRMDPSGTSCGIVVADRAVLYAMYEYRVSIAQGKPSILYEAALNPTRLDEQTLIACGEALRAAVEQAAGEGRICQVGSAKNYTRAAVRDEYYNMYGSFVFLGIFLAIMFMMATVLIIYYKQVSEGYEDRERFVILQKVGMSAAEVRRTIQSQVLMVFFLPLAVAALHMAAAFPMLLRMVGLFGITNGRLFLGCMAATLAGFGACYVAVYVCTARKYYKIVRM